MLLAVTALLVFGRIGGLLVVLPVFSAEGVPRWIGVFAALALALLIGPLVPAPPEGALASTLTLGLAGEIGFGMLFGGIVRAMFASVTMGAETMSTQTGLAMAVVFDPLQRSQEPLLGTLASWLAGLAFLAANLHLLCIDIVARSFHEVPPGAVGMPVDGAMAMGHTVGTAVILGAQFAAPVIALVMLINVFMALLIKLAPRMNVFFSIGMTASNGVGLIVVMLALPWVLLAHGDVVAQSVVTATTAMVGAP